MATIGRSWVPPRESARAPSDSGTTATLGRTCASRGSSLDLVAAKLLADDHAKGILEAVILALNVLAKRSIDRTLVVATARGVHAPAEPIQHVVIDSDRDSRLAPWRRQYRPPDDPRKVAIFFHLLLSYRLRSVDVAKRAEMIRIRCRRQV